jgi:hypothetical protein
MHLTKKIISNLLYRVNSPISNFFYHKQWCLGYYIGEDLETDITKFRKILPPKNIIWADPFVVKYGKDKFLIFFEELIEENKKGYISLIEIDNTGRYSKSIKVLEEPYHLSYPFIFRYNNNWYMVPESTENQTVDLYIAYNFPYRWKKCFSLLKGVRAADPTLLLKNEYWWLFVTISSDIGLNEDEDLFLFYSKKLLSNQWEPVCKCKIPIISDVSRARPAGNIFYYNNYLIRPSQDCSKRYGFGLNLNYITKIEHDDYKEKVFLKVVPNKHDKSILGIHTIAYSPGLTVVDFFIKRRKIF